MKRVFVLLAAGMIVLAATACGRSSAASSAAVSEAAPSSNAVSVDENLFSVTMTFPASWVGEDATQEQLDQEIAKNDGIQSATLNADGSATYVMTKAYHKQMVQDVVDSIHESLEEMVQSEDYPNFTAVEANDDFTQFTVTTESTELGLSEAMSTLGFYMYGGVYGIVTGQQPDNIHVDFVNAETGQVIQSADSADIGSDSTSGSEG